MTERADLEKSKEQLLEERRMVEQALRDALAQMQGVINTAVDGIIAISERGILQWLNPAALQTFGYTAGELIGRNIKVLMPEPYHSQHDQYLLNYLETARAKIIGIGREVQGRRKDGSVFPLDLAVSEVKLGDRRMFTGIVRDITLRKQAESELVQAKDAAVAASAAKDQFLAVVSHELRTPLTPILAAVSFLESYEDLPDEVREEIVSIRRNTEHEARLVEDLLNFMKLARGKIELHQEAVDAHALVRTVLTQFQNDIDAKEVQLSTALRARQHYIWADPTRVRQVLTNLVDNAIKFSHRGGEISVQSSNVNGRFHVEVIDGGIGIEPEVQARLFNPFEQGEQTISRRYGGLGLGLAISKGIIDLHGGKLSCRSAGRGTGASFIVELDVVPVVSEDALPPPAVPPANGSLRVLLVEDHHDTLRVMSKLLRALGYSVIGATTVAAAVELADREAFDVLVSDIGLPDGTGMDLLRKIKSKRPFKAVAVSGFGQEEDRIRSKQAGFLEHLTKPVDFQRLQAVLKQMQNVS